MKTIAHRKAASHHLNTLGEIQRAGKHRRASDILNSACAIFETIHKRGPSGETLTLKPTLIATLHSSIRLRSDVAENSLTESDADQLQALAILDGALNGLPVRVPWLDRLQLWCWMAFSISLRYRRDCSV